jgi:hypothetical protein
VSGTVYWAKVFKPVANYENTGREWTMDFVPDDTSFLKEHRLLDRLKEPRAPIEDDYIRLRKPELDSEGNKNDPITIIDADNNKWDIDTHGEIGNGSKVDMLSRS